MKRKLLFFCFCQAFGIVFGYYIKIGIQQLCIICTAAFLVLGLLLLWDARRSRRRWKTDPGSRERRAKGAAVLAGIALWGFGALYCRSLEIKEYASSSLDGEFFRGEAFIKKCELRQGYCLLTARCRELGETVLIRLDSEDRALAYSSVGCRVNLSGTMELPSPAFGVISCGRNNSFGHPAPRVIDLLEESGIIYGRTDLDGAISLLHPRDGSLSLRNGSRTKKWQLAGNYPKRNKKELKWPLRSIHSGP